MKPRKQIKIFTCDAEQSAIIELTEDNTGVCLNCCEENDNKKSFVLYMTKYEAVEIGNELVRYAQNL